MGTDMETHGNTTIRGHTSTKIKQSHECCHVSLIYIIISILCNTPTGGWSHE